MQLTTVPFCVTIEMADRYKNKIRQKGEICLVSASLNVAEMTNDYSRKRGLAAGGTASNTDNHRSDSYYSGYDTEEKQQTEQGLNSLKQFPRLGEISQGLPGKTTNFLSK